MSAAFPRGPLTAAEKQWQQQFQHKLDNLASNASFSTNFLDPVQRELAEAMLRDNRQWSFTVYGGYPGAERVCLHVFPAARAAKLPPIACVEVTVDSGGANLTHRDFLGAVLGLGLKRNQVGDIFFLPGGKAVIMVLASMAPFICANLSRVGAALVHCREVKPGELPLPEPEGKEITGTVASLRLDAVLSLGFGFSRSKAVPLIKSGLVKVNWRPVESPSHQLHAGDVISLQGRGRLEVISLTGETRKGRQRLQLKKFN